ncbi:pumilio homolog 12-like [Malania oleifera]|uniref:pumilio homolog 12-like n=1 Tax=Malania oleifera TaxID=397392 RepID=UPI0025ADD292|nr:pumilio homolog 12-like [Malania oleifera]
MEKRIKKEKLAAQITASWPVSSADGGGRRLPQPGTAVQRPLLFETHSDQTLEASFARLDLSAYPRGPSYTLPSRHGGVNGGESVLETPALGYSIGDRALLPLSLHGKRQTNGELQSSSLRDDGVGTFENTGLPDYGRYPLMVRSDFESWDGYVLGSIPNELLSDPDPIGLFDGLISEERTSNSSSNHHPGRLMAQDLGLDYLLLKDLQGQIVPLAMDQYGCRFLQTKFDDIKDDEIEMIFSEVIDYVSILMVDPFGNYLFQRLVEVCSDEQRTRIVLSLTRNDFQLVAICLNMHGTRAVQKLLDRLTTKPQISLVMSVLSRSALSLSKDNNGHHVIKHCLERFNYEDNKHLLNEVADNSFAIATDKSGCCVLQSCIEHSQGECREHLVAEITVNALPLAEDRYGNYVVQYLLEMKIARVITNLLRQLKGSYASLSCNKYGSNVVEKCLLESRREQSEQIILELLRSPNVSMLLLDPFGNYVIQTALSVSEGFVSNALQNLVRVHYSSMRNNLYGKKVLAWFEKRKQLQYIC